MRFGREARGTVNDADDDESPSSDAVSIWPILRFRFKVEETVGDDGELPADEEDQEEFFVWMMMRGVEAREELADADELEDAELEEGRLTTLMRSGRVIAASGIVGDTGELELEGKEVITWMCGA